FLLVHVLDTALVRVSPEAYNEVIGHYKTVVFGLGEVGLVAAVVFHALNGLRIILVDFWSGGTRHHRKMFWGVVALWVLLMAGVLLVVLAFGHLFVNLWLGEGVQGIDFAFVAGKWTSPFWQVWDLTMLWLGLLHGGNGVRTIIEDYARNSTLRLTLKGLLYF